MKFLDALRSEFIHDVKDPGAYITTASQKVVMLFDHLSDGSSIDINDIAHSLCNLNRWNGHTERPVSIAWHSLLVSALAELGHEPLMVCKWALLHDASEAYLGDVVSPLKDSMPQYKRIETYMQHRIADQFNTHVVDVKHYDKMALAIEDKLFRSGHLGFQCPSLFSLFDTWSGGGVCTPGQFIARFETLWSQ